MTKTSNRERIVKNYQELLAHGQKKLRETALEIIQAGIKGADPGVGTHEAVKLRGHNLLVGKKEYDLRHINHIYVVGAGKGAFPIAESLEKILGSRINQGVVMVKRGEKRRLKRIEVIEAGHPIPDENSVIGATKILQIAKAAGEGDLVFAAITGGSSALAALPPEGLKLEEIQKLTDMLLKSGAPIRDINAVRKHLSQLGGGLLVSHIQPAEAITLTLDTRAKDLPWPDMCLPDPSTFQDAIDVLNYYDLWNSIPPSIKQYLSDGRERPELETVKSFEGIKATMTSVASPSGACEAAAKRAEELGYNPAILSTHIDGEAAIIGICLAGIAQEIVEKKRPFSPPCVLISGGEMKVRVADKGGTGGPNQEFVLSFAEQLGPTHKVCCASVDTDGSDGPTDIAGGIVDGETVIRAKKSNINITSFLKNHNSSAALKMLGDTIITGHTGTNIVDLRVILIDD
ncbi:MAG: glycerate kinase [Chloroflexi bacterium]|nr:MAG: glycerate kinase [Chloroflexota bacterium]